MPKKKTKSEFSQPMLFDTDGPLAQAIPEPVAASIQPAASLVGDPQSRTPSDGPNASEPQSNCPLADDLVILVDSHSLIYQVFHALPPMTSPHGVEVGAVHGFLRDIARFAILFIQLTKLTVKRCPKPFAGKSGLSKRL
jgi:DNA polymerase-1